eukprot:superscaffoldBa00008561_g23448
MTPVKEKLFETLEELCFWEFLQFNDILQKLRRQKHLPRVQIKRTYSTVDLVDLMVELYGQQSVEVTREVLKKMNRMDLVQSLSDTSSGSKALGSSSGATGGNTLAEGRSTEEQSVDELSALVQKAATVTTIKEKLLKMLQRLREEKFEDFKWFLQDRDLIPAELPCIPQSKLEKADRKHVVDLMEQTYSQQAAEVTKMLFKKINRNDLVKQL